MCSLEAQDVLVYNRSEGRCWAGTCVEPQVLQD